MSPSPEIVVVGSYMQDRIYRCDQFPRPGETVLGVHATGPGGKGSNQAVAAGRAGARTTFVGAVGPGASAQAVRDFYRTEKIGCVLAEKPGQATGSAAILVNGEGQNEIIVAPGANARLAPADIPRSLLVKARVVVVQLETNLRATAFALRAARRAGVTTLLNPAPMRTDFDPALLRAVDILIPNETEFAALAGLLPACGRSGFSESDLPALSGENLHALCRTLGVPTVIVTLGARGCFVSQPSGHAVLPAHRGIEVVDTTGAGDAFCGGFAAGLVRFAGDVTAAARFGNAVAALSVTKPGAAPSMPRRREIEAFLKKRKA